MSLPQIEAYSPKLKKKMPLLEKVEFKKQANGSYMIKGQNNGSTMTTMMGAVKADDYIKAGATVVESFSY